MNQMLILLETWYLTVVSVLKYIFLNNFYAIGSHKTHFNRHHKGLIFQDPIDNSIAYTHKLSCQNIRILLFSLLS